MSKSKSEKIPKWRLSISKIGSRFISAVDWDILSKFFMQIHFHVIKQIPLLNVNLEVHFRLCGRHLEKSIWRRDSATDRPITTKFGRQMQNGMPMIMHRSKSKPEIKFQYGDRPNFPKPEVVLSQPWIEISRQNLACRYISTFLNRYRH